MYITDDGIRLNASLEMPKEKKEKYSLAVILHGFTGHMEERHILAISHMLNEIGCATLRADLYGHGHSGGEFRNHTLYKWLGNTLTLIDYARSLDFVSDIYLCGHSQGGLTAMLTGALKHDVLRGLILLSPASMIPEGARQGQLLGYPFDPERIPDEIPAWNNQTLGGNYIRVAQSIRVEEYIPRYEGSVLLVHGDADGAVPVQCSIDAAKQYKNAELAIIAGDGHCYENHLDQAVKAVRGWMEKQIREEKKA